jgi:hypothetical protein
MLSNAIVEHNRQYRPMIEVQSDDSMKYEDHFLNVLVEDLLASMVVLDRIYSNFLWNRLTNHHVDSYKSIE